MALRFMRHAALAVTLMTVVRAQKQSNIIPDDLQAGFTTDTQVQASYTGEAVNGFRDGTSFAKDAVAKEPTFALGDSSGISPQTLYTIIMVDTTCPNARKLHYARANFKNNFDITNIDTKSAALQAYKAPGSFGETGDNRQYSFLMYTNPGRKQIDQLKLPTEGENFDIKQFQSDNGLPDASAGVGMVVKLGGQADCSGDEANTLPATLPTPRPAPSTATRPSNAGPTSNATSITQQTSTAPSATPTGDSNEDSDSPSSASSSDSGPTEVSTALSTNAAGSSTIISTIFLSSARPSASGTPITSAGSAQQSVSAASGLAAAHGMVAMMFAVLGLLF